MSANIDKMSIVIKNYFSAECDVNTTIRQAYERGFRRGASKCDVLNMRIRELYDEYGKLNEEHAKLCELLCELYEDQCDECDQWKYRDRMRELEIGVTENE